MDGPISSLPWCQFSANQGRRWRGGRGALRWGLGRKMAGLGSPQSPARTARAPLTSTHLGATRSGFPSHPGGNSPGSPHTPLVTVRGFWCRPVCPHTPLQPPQVLFKTNKKEKQPHHRNTKIYMDLNETRSFQKGITTFSSTSQHHCPTPGTFLCPHRSASLITPKRCRKC